MQRIEQAAEISNEPNDDYHADTDWVSSTMLKTLDKSPRVFEWEYIKGNRSKESDSMRLGSAVHAAVLEPQVFADSYIVCPKDCSDKRTKKHKEWAATINEGVIVLSQGEMDTVNRCADAIRGHEFWPRYEAMRPVCEESIRWTDLESGVPCKARLDMRMDRARMICDVKTISSLNDGDFKKGGGTYRYHIQAEHYLRAAMSIIPSDDWKCHFLAVETSAPYRCKAYKWGVDTSGEGAKLVSFLLSQYALRSESGDWSEATERGLNEVEMPRYFFKPEEYFL